ncbi:hypothetical protein FACS1894167_06900 [Synergistales bacterium]|nr:hypothetical protein FACS1894167_06900 [Synergistales bacterium]
MLRKEYSAGAVKLSFWFSEFRKVISLLCSGKQLPEIKLMAVAENLFSAKTALRASQIMNTVAVRVFALPAEFYSVFETNSLEVQKLINLISIMNTDSLFFTFIYEVYREKLITGDNLLADADVRVFFMNKQRESEKVAGWTDETLIRLQKCYKTYLSEAGLLERGVGSRKIIRPLLDDNIAKLLAGNDMELISHTLTGTR